MSADRVPPNAAEHVRLFRDLAAAHGHLVRLLPVPDIVDADNRNDYWSLVVRASSMRKFVLLPSDNCYLPTVFSKMEESLDHVATRDPQFVVKAREAFTQRSDASTYITRNADYLAQAMVEDIVYGLLIHGDYGRFQRVAAQDHLGFVHSALFEWLGHFEDLLEQVLDFVDSAIESGHLLEDTAG